MSKQTKEENLVLRGVVVKLYPSEAQEELLRKNIGCCRFIYNYFLSKKIKAYTKDKSTLGRKEMSDKLTRLKLKKPWLTEVDSTSLQQSIIDLETSYKNFFKHGFGFPKFKKRGINASFCCVMSNKYNSTNGKLKIGKHGWFTVRGDVSRLIDNNIRSITVRYEAGNWYASCLVKVPKCEAINHKYDSCGVDIGVAKPLTIAYEGKKEVKTIIRGLEFKKKLSKKEKLRKRQQRNLARKKKGSKNREKQKLKVAKAYLKERNYRKNWVEQTSNYLSNTFREVKFEALKIKNMTRSARGTKENPGTNVKAKSGLNREMLRLGISNLFTRTEQKAIERGGVVTYINPRFTSQTCSECGCIDKASRKSQSKFECTSCDHEENADRNAAKIILKKAA